MNQLLFDRSTGDLGPKAFARIQTSHLVHAIQLAPRLRFSGGEKEILPVDDERASSVPPTVSEERIWSHQAGANALAIDVENRL